MGQAQPVIEAEIFPDKKVRENGAPITVSASFKNLSSQPVVLLAIRCRDGQDVEIQRDQFLGWQGRSKRQGERYHRYNLLAPGESEALRVENPGRPGSFRYELSLEYVAVTDAELDLPVFEMAMKQKLKRNPPTYAPLEEYEQYTEKKAVGTLRSVLGKRANSTGFLPRGLPYFLDVTADMLKRAETRRIARVLTVEPDPEIAQLHAVHPEVLAYRSGIPHFGLAFRKDADLFVGKNGRYRRLGKIGFEAIAHIGALLEKRLPVRLSLWRGAACLEREFADRKQPPDPNIGQAVELGQGLPFIEVQAQDLEKVWRCMERDGTSLELTPSYQYLVVGKPPAP